MTVIDNVLVLEEKEPVHLEKEIADVVHFSNMEGILDIRHAIGNYMNRLLIASKGSFFCIQKRMYKAVVRGSNLITGNSVECGRVLQRGSYVALLHCREPLEMQSILLDICGQMRTYKQRQCQKKERE